MVLKYLQEKNLLDDCTGKFHTFVELCWNKTTLTALHMTGQKFWSWTYQNIILTETSTSREKKYFI